MGNFVRLPAPAFQAHLAMGLVSIGTLDFTQASEAYERALALWHFDAGVAAARASP
jgi:hypothetical protein